MAELPSVIPIALIHVINTLESDDKHQYHWKISRNSENVSLFVKCIHSAKSVTRDKVVPGSFPVKPAGKKSRKENTPSALRRSAKRLKRFQEKQAADQATLPKSPAKEVVSAVRKEQETITVSSKDSCKDLESSDRSSIERSTCVKQGLKHFENQASENLSLAEERAILLEVLEETSIGSDDDLQDAGECANCHRQPEKGLEIKKCTRCRITRYCSKECHKKDWSFHCFACDLVAKQIATITSWPLTAYRRTFVQSIYINRLISS